MTVTIGADRYWYAMSGDYFFDVQSCESFHTICCSGGNEMSGFGIFVVPVSLMGSKYLNTSFPIVRTIHIDSFGDRETYISPLEALELGGLDIGCLWEHLVTSMVLVLVLDFKYDVDCSENEEVNDYADAMIDEENEIHEAGVEAHLFGLKESDYQFTNIGVSTCKHCPICTIFSMVSWIISGLDFEYDADCSENEKVNDYADVMIDEENEIHEAGLEAHLFDLRESDYQFTNIGVSSEVPDNVSMEKDAFEMDIDVFHTDSRGEGDCPSGRISALNKLKKAFMQGEGDGSKYAFYCG
nr:hypothetical protein [Tanacetum cinerariifolium]